MFAERVRVPKVATWLLCATLFLWTVALVAVLNVSPAAATSAPCDDGPVTVTSETAVLEELGNESTEYSPPTDLADGEPDTPQPLASGTETELLEDPLRSNPQDSELATPLTPEADATVEDEPETDADTLSDAEADAEAEPDVEATTDAEADADAESSTNPETDVDADTDADAGTESDALNPEPGEPLPTGTNPEAEEAQGDHENEASETREDPSTPSVAPDTTPVPQSTSPADRGGVTPSTSLPKVQSPQGTRSLGPQGYPAPITGLLGDDYPLKYKMIPLYPVVWDEWNFAHRQRTSFVAWRLQQVNQVQFANASLGVARWGNGGQWGDAARKAGFLVDGTPAVGAVAFNEPFHNGTGSAGHVAWVAEVLDDGRIIIEEYNYTAPGGRYGARIVPKEAFSGFIHIRDLAEAPTRPDAEPTPESETSVESPPQDKPPVVASVTFPSKPAMNLRQALWMSEAPRSTGLETCVRTLPWERRADPNVGQQCWLQSFYGHMVDPLKRAMV